MIRTEHAGAKNGGGFWGRREEAKTISRVKRRMAGKREERAAMIESGPLPEAYGRVDHASGPISPDGAWFYDYDQRAWRPMFRVSLRSS
jgi:hypothetical protein